MVLSSLNRIFAVENLYTMRKTVLYIILLTLVLSACTSPDHEAMRQRLKYVSDCNRADTVFTERWLPTVDSLVTYFDRHGSANDRMMAHYVQGRVYHDMGEAPKALECYQKAAEQADTTRSDCDLYTLYAVFGQMATLFHSQYLPDDEMQALKTAERIAWKDHDTLAALKEYELRIRPYFLRNEKDSMLYVMEDVREKYSRNGYRKEAAQAIFPAIDIYLERNQLQQAEYYLNYYEKESGNFDNNGDLIYGGAYYYNKGYHLLAVGQDEAACIYFYKALDRGQKEAGYYGLLSLYEKRNEPDSIAKYAKLFASANDSSYLHVNQQQVEQIRALYNYSRQQQIAEKNRQEAKTWMIAVIGTVMAAMLMVSILLLAFYHFKTRRLQEVSYLKEKKEYLEQLMIKKDASAEEIRREIVRLNNKNASNSKMYKETINRLQTQIDTLQQKLLETLQTAEADPSAEHIVILFKQKLQDYHSGNNPPTESEWEQLKKSFSVNHRSGYQLVTSSYNLTEEQIRVCLMTMLDISESMMAFALNTDRKRIDRVKRQANKKLFGEDNASALKSNLRLYYP